MKCDLPRWHACLLASVLACVASQGALAVPRSNRTPALPGPKTLATTALHAGAVQVTLGVDNVRSTQRGIVQGARSTADADVFLFVDVQTAAAQVLGGNNAGDFIPWQQVRVKIENVVTTDVVEFNLVPHVGSVHGWTYGSHVRLPPAERDSNPFQDAYKVTVSLAPQPPVVLLDDALPPSALWRADGPVTVLSTQAVLGPVVALPVHDVPGAAAVADAWNLVRTAVGQGDLAAARGAYVGTLQDFVRRLQDATLYDPARQLAGGVLAGLDASVVAALSGGDVDGECNGDVAACGAWALATLERAFILAAIQDGDAAAAAAGRGDSAAASLAWDRAYVWQQQVRALVLTSELQCLTGPPREPTVVDCGMATGLDEVLVGGANAASLADAAALSTAADILTHQLLKHAYFHLAHHLVLAVQGGVDLERVRARVAFRAFHHLVPYSQRLLVDAVLARPAGLTGVDARDILARINPFLAPGSFTAAELVLPDDLLGVTP